MGKREAIRNRGNPQAGFSLLELAITSALLSVGLLAYMMQITLVPQMIQTDRETTLALNAARARLEMMRDYGTFEQTYAAYNSITGDDPAGAAGANFAVAGLTVRAGDPDGMCGQVRFPEDPANPGTLVEGWTDAGLGCPCDMNRDGDTADTYFGGGANYRLLPVAVRVEWQTANGRSRSLEVRTLLAKK